MQNKREELHTEMSHLSISGTSPNETSTKNNFKNQVKKSIDTKNVKRTFKTSPNVSELSRQENSNNQKETFQSKDNNASSSSGTNSFSKEINLNSNPTLQNKIKKMHVKRQQINGITFLFVSGVKGRYGTLEKRAQRLRADIIVNSGDFGFFDSKSYDTIPHLQLQEYFKSNFFYHLNPDEKEKMLALGEKEFRKELKSMLLFSQLPSYLDNTNKFSVPIYTIWGKCEDIRVVEKFRNGQYKIPNLFILDETNSVKIENIRLFGLGGAIVLKKLFDTGSSSGVIAGENGAMWTTLIQIADLINMRRSIAVNSEEKVLFFCYTPSVWQPLVSLLAKELDAHYVFSGSMRLQESLVYKDRIFRSYKSWSSLFEVAKREINTYWKAIQKDLTMLANEKEVESMTMVINLLENIPTELEFGKSVNVCLPSVDSGHAKIKLLENFIRFETSSSKKKKFIRNSSKDNEVQLKLVN